MIYRLLLLSVLQATISCAQIPQVAPADSVQTAPGTFVVTGKITASSGESLTVVIVEVKEMGSGIVNPVAPGQQVHLGHRHDSRKLKPGDRIELILRETLGLDNAMTTYEIVQFKKTKVRS
jgi:hypothetical protein